MYDTWQVNQLEANRQEMAMLRNAERAKKAYDKEVAIISLSLYT